MRWGWESDKGGNGGAPTSAYPATNFFIPAIQGEQPLCLSGKGDSQFAMSCHFYLITSRI